VFSASNLSIVPASRDDAELLAGIHRESFPHYWNPEAFTDFFAVDGTVALVAYFPSRTGGGRVGALSVTDVATASPIKPPSNSPLRGEDKVVVGMVVHRVQYEQADIITIAVRPAFRRRGIAAALVQASLDKAAAQGAEKIFLDVEETNAAAIALYEKFGFTPIRRRKQYYQQKDGSFTDALVMQRKLA